MTLTIRRLARDDDDALARLFDRLRDDPEVKNYFRPHELDAETARSITARRGRDVFLGAFDEERCLGYAFLRGWDEGFDVPTFGAAVDPAARGAGVGRALLERCLEEARRVSATEILLHVHPDNADVVGWYEREGFVRTGVRDDGLLQMRRKVTP